MKIRTLVLLLVGPFLLSGNPVFSQEALQEDETHVATWNRFAEQTLALHRQLIDEHDVERQTTTGGYAHLPEFYRQESYFHDGELISRVQWEIESGDLHVIEVFIRDDEGRVVRDYTAAYLPEYHNAPTQTLVSFHAYNKGLHAFRSFDASGELNVERCTGTHEGEPVELLVDLGSVFGSAEEDRELQQTPVYRRCFADLPEKPGKYLQPQ
ncbi:MAG: hypothetical protein RI563_02955 [Thiohalophilus sp.]|uniref:hypothetical protein n=1 Tax=Thiohalophilus sp. TaxID=3028392 RepID=UPI002870054E|nr:hypothetical protein [Thiohalophilus sp.]MDR9435807.1 hypothetical protein [Thiohalophilus sp.]